MTTASGGAPQARESITARIRRLSAAATLGPWAVHPVLAQVDAFANGEPMAICQMLWPTDARSEEETEANESFIAAMRTDAPAAADLIDHLAGALRNFIAAYEAPSGRGWYGRCDEAKVEARAALAKIEES
jgi:hypothetical protein